MSSTQPYSRDPARDAALQNLTSWVAAIADKVNNPVASTLSTLALIERELERKSSTGTFDEQLVALSVSRIRSRLLLLAEYVQELSNFGKPDPCSPMPVHLPTELSVVLSNLETRGEITGEIEVGALVARVHADASRLKVALGALIVNGWQATAREPEPKVAVSASETPNEVTISVEDNGPGFSEASAQRAGEPFFSTKEAGTGLGLAIVKKFAEAHGGRLAVERSTALGGAKVSLILPIVRREVAK